MSSAFLSSRPPARWWRKYRVVLRLGICFLSIYLTATVAVFFRSDVPGISLIWVSNGILLSYLLLSPRWRWPYLVCIAFAAFVASGLSVHDTGLHAMFLAALNIVEVFIGVIPLRRGSHQLPHFTERKYLFKFIGFAVIAGPLATGMLFAALSVAFHHPFGTSPVFIWTLSDGLGTAVITPACVAIFRSHLRASGRWTHRWIYPSLLIVVTVASFCTVRVPFIFLIYPLLLLILLRKGLGWAALSTLYVGAAGSWLTFHGAGPFAASVVIHPNQPGVMIQLFVGTGIFMLYNVSLLLEHQKTSERRLHEMAALHALVTENLRDVILITDTMGQPSYISPAIERVTGWSPDEVRKHATSLIHPDDLPQIQEHVEESRTLDSASIIEYRLRKRNGEFVWVEASIKALKDSETGAFTGTLNLLRDISERKRAEEQLEDAYHVLETLAVTDALTGLANRRRFDQYLAVEWRRNMRDRKPLSLLLMDVDLFKAYNDLYGHLRGDGCLKHIAQVAIEVVTRPGDLVARFGGEEFAVILPNTENAGAFQIAVEICNAVRARRFAHATNPSGVLTVSIGCATMIPRARQDDSVLIELADRALYTAKRNGRDQVVNTDHCALETDADEVSVTAESPGGSPGTPR